MKCSTLRYDRRGPRPERGPRTEEVSADGVVQNFVDTIPVALPEGGTAEGEARDGRRRRRRGGRDRGEGRAGEEGQQALPQAPGDAASGPTPADDLANDGMRDARTDAPVADAAATAEGGGERERGRGRGRGRGRDREGAREPRTEQGAGAGADPGADRSDMTPMADAPAAATAAQHVPLDAVADDLPTLPVTAQAEVPTAPDVSDAPAWAQAAPVPQAVAASMAAQTAASAPLRASPAAAPLPAQPVRIEPYVLPTDTLATLAATAGLQWVQSDNDKISAVQAVMAAEPAPARAPRSPRRQELLDDGPLVLVETRKDLSQLKLPFESGAVR